MGGPLVLPKLDIYALKTTKTSNFFSVRASTRPSNLNASFSTLSQVRTVILTDDSSSMTESGYLSWGSDYRGYPESRWLQARRLLAGIAPLGRNAQPARHGIDLHFLNRTPFLLRRPPHLRSGGIRIRPRRSEQRHPHGPPRQRHPRHLNEHATPPPRATTAQPDRHQSPTAKPATKRSCTCRLKST